MCAWGRLKVVLLSFGIFLGLGASPALAAINDCPSYFDSSEISNLLPKAQSGIVAVVDVYSHSGAALVRALWEQGYQVVHVVSGPQVPARYHVEDVPFIGTFYLNADLRGQYKKKTRQQFQDGLNQLSQQLRQLATQKGLPLVAIGSGSESSVELTQFLAKRMGMASNPGNIFQTRALRDKYFMHETLKRKGIASAEQLVTSNVEAAVDFFRNQWKLGRRKIVIKPRSDAGTQGVETCNSENQVREAFKKWLGKDSAYGKINELLVQEHLVGSEYVLNFVIKNGVSVLTGLWKYEKASMSQAEGGDAPIYLRDLLQNSKSATDRLLVEYALNVASALGIRNSPAHFEIIMTTDRGPVLVEVGSRIMGGYNWLQEKACTGRDPAILYAMMLTNPNLFFKTISDPSFGDRLSYDLQCHAQVVNLVVESPIQVTSTRKFNALLDNLGLTLRENHVGLRAFQKLVQTKNLSDSPGELVLLGSSQGEVDHAYKIIRAFESDPKAYTASSVEEFDQELEAFAQQKASELLSRLKLGRFPRSVDRNFPGIQSALRVQRNWLVSLRNRLKPQTPHWVRFDGYIQEWKALIAEADRVRETLQSQSQN